MRKLLQINQTLTYCLVLLFSLSQAKAQDWSEYLPAGHLSLQQFLNFSVKRSSEFERIQSQLRSKSSRWLRAQAQLDWKLESSLSKLIDESDTRGGLTPDKKDVFGLEAKLSKAFRTGSYADLTVKNQSTALTYPDSFTQDPRFSNFLGTTEYAEPSIELNLSQDLWRNAFGHNTIKQLEAGKLAEESAELRIQGQSVEWLIGMSDMFYNAWLAQRQVVADQQDLKRQERLVEITRLQTRRGTAEKADLLQAKGSLALVEKKLSSSRQKLDEIWTALIVQLKFPDRFLSLSPLSLPLKLDNGEEQAAKLCNSSASEKGWPTDNHFIQRLQKDLEAAQEQVQVAENQKQPSLRLLAGIGANSIDENFSKASEDLAQADHPKYRVGLQFSMPFSSHQAEADYQEALVQQANLESQLTSEMENLKSKWISGCKNIQRLKDNVTSLTSTVELQKERVESEERRFRLGRTQILNVIQAGKDLNQSQLTLYSTQIELKKQAWQIRKLNGDVKDDLLQLQNQQL